MLRSGAPHPPSAGGGRATGRSAVRLRRATARDPRLWSGLALITVSVVAGALLLHSGDETVPVWRATRDLSVGARPGSDPTALELVQVSRAIAGDRYAGRELGSLTRLRWPVSAGELIPVTALSEGTTQTRLVTVPVDPLHAPAGLAPGERVDAWSMADGMPDSAAEATLVLPGALVVDIATEVGITGDWGVVLEVPEGMAGDLVAATRAGAIDLVAVPLSGQAADLDPGESTP